ncbi:MAG: SLC13 family permease [Saprospiraceae bacterium]|nr:SLC13 family permease [Saprospiraceae bacterium]MCF8249460.1 SLC13 family permease [Saprospiraceae bacterium]MCF8279114.1 SLC13 family permease [Bacteroidales bacterium]MCF8311589.1 SLC13 family permease [Saprospiraceae bacterium]MCF8440079.1 SLC13 family permease [Saprospiraceae bacterium]
MQIALVLGLLVLAIVLFATEKATVDLITIGLLIMMTTLGILTPAEAFSGFGSDFIIMLASIFVVGGAMQKAGILEILSTKLFILTRNRVRSLPTILMASISFISAFMNNTTVTAMFVGPVVGLARKLKISPSKLLMPMAHASILGGTCTVIGTSTNIAVNAYLGKKGLPTFAMFDFLLIGLVLCAIGIAFLATIGMKILPDYKEVDMMQDLQEKHYFSEILVKKNSKLVGQRIRETVLSKMELRVLNIIRDKHNTIADSNTVVEANDILLVEGSLKELMKVKNTNGIDILADTMVAQNLVSEDIQVAEILIMPTHDFVGQTIKESNFRRRFGLTVMAINREGQTLSEKIGSTEIKSGDRLLVQGPADVIRFRKSFSDFIVLQEHNYELDRSTRNATLSGSFFIGAIILGTFEIIPLSIAFMLAAFLCVLFKCIQPEEAYEKIEWKLLVLIGGMTSYGVALQKSGAAAFLAENINDLVGGMGPTAVLAAYVLFTILLTQPMSNAAAALVMLPVALQSAESLHVNPVTFALGVMLGASVSLITPFEPSCILVYGPGRYKFSDYLKVGSIATILLFIVIMIMVPMLYPF